MVNTILSSLVSMSNSDCEQDSLDGESHAIYKAFVHISGFNQNVETRKFVTPGLL